MEVAAASTAEGKCQGEAKVTVGLIITRHLFGVWVQRWDIKQPRQRLWLQLYDPAVCAVHPGIETILEQKERKKKVWEPPELNYHKL